MVPRVSVIIRCFNEEEHIGRLLSGILQQSVTDVEIILVDSGSTDATLAIANRYPVKVVSIRPQEFSFGRSLNVGCRAAAADVIAICSAHTYPVYTDWLEQLLAPFADPQVALAYGKQRGHEQAKYAEQQVFAHWFPNQSNWFQTHPFCNNANAAIRRSLWQQWPYNEELTGLEDLDWAHQIIAQGYRLAYVAEAEVVHVHSETWRQVYNRYRREAIAFKRVFPQEKFYLWDFVRLFVTNVFSDYYHALRDGVLHRHVWPIPLFRLMQFWGTYRGYAHRGPITGPLRQTFYYPRALARPVTQMDAARRGRAIDYNQSAQEKSVGQVR
jgi:glycosyltransferase involved in cell wall biosynthesis